MPKRRHALGAASSTERDVDFGAQARIVRGDRRIRIAEHAQHRALRAMAHECLQQAGRIGRSAGARIVLRVGKDDGATRIHGDRHGARHRIVRLEQRHGEVGLALTDVGGERIRGGVRLRL